MPNHVDMMGRLTLHKWKDAHGCDRKAIGIVAGRLHFASSRPETGDESGGREREPGNAIPYASEHYYDLTADYENAY